MTHTAIHETEKFRFHIRTERHGDCDVIHKVIELDSYRLHEFKNAGLELQVILDIGAHIGTFAVLAHSLWPDAAIYAFEPNERSFELLCLNARFATCVNAAVSYREAAILADGEGATGGGFLTGPENFDEMARTKAAHDHFVYSALEQDVTLLTIEDVLEQYGIEAVDLIKLDCEGSEIDCFQHIQPETARKAGSVLGEYHLIGEECRCKDFQWFKELAESAFPHLEFYGGDDRAIGLFWSRPKRKEGERNDQDGEPWHKAVPENDSLRENDSLNHGASAGPATPESVGKVTAVPRVTEATTTTETTTATEATGVAAETHDRERSFKHSGDIGDLLYALPTVRALGGGKLYLAASDVTRQRMDASILELLRPLLMLQSYISDVELSTGKDVSHDLDGFRSYWNAHRTPAGTIAAYHLAAFGLNETELDAPWLEVDAQDEGLASSDLNALPVVFCRSPRHHNSDFPWQRIVDRYRGLAVFAGLPEEHEAFCREFGELPFHPTSNFLELARLINNCKLFVGNQSAPYAVAEGLKARVIQEVYPPDPNCLFPRTGALFVWNGTVTLPDI